MGGVENHAFFVKDWLESQGHEVVPFAMLEDESADSAAKAYFPSAVDFRFGGLSQSVRAIERATISSESRRNLKQLLTEMTFDGAYVLHVYHQIGTAILNDLSDANIPTVLSIHDYKIACPNYRLFSERTGQICTRCLEAPNAYLTAPVLEGCWSGSHSAGVVLSVEALMTRVRASYRKPQVVAILNSLQRRAAEHAGVDPQRLVQIPHPVILGAARFGQPKRQFAYVGRLVPEKGVDVLLRAVAKAGVPLIIVGDGRSRPELEAEATSLGADVVFLGELDQEAALQIMNESLALVVPSTWHEVSPLVVYEAIASDVPVVATSVGGMIDQLGDGRGFLVEPGSVDDLAQTLAKIFADPKDAALRSAQARKYAAEHWTLEAWELNMRTAFLRSGVSV